MHALVKFAVFASVALIALSLWNRDTLPPPESVHADLAQAPWQGATDDPPFDMKVNGVAYRVTPRHAYELHGLVVSLHDADTWWDYAHAEWNDHVNVVDLCVVWGANAQRGAYRGMQFRNDQWTCHFSTGSSEVWRAFDVTAASNNHMVTDDPAIARAMRKVRVGDQIRFRGYLADYTTFRADGGEQGTRVSSTVRTDTGNGACEVVYVKSFDIIRPASRVWSVLGKAGVALLIVSLIVWFCLPYRPADAVVTKLQSRAGSLRP